MDRRSARREPRVGDLRRLSVTLPQAAHILNVDVRQVRKAVERQVVVATLVRQGNRQVRTLDGVDVLCLRMKALIKNTIRQDVYSKIKQASDQDALNDLLTVSGMHDKNSEAHRVSGLVEEIAIETVAGIRALGDVTRLVDGEGRIRDADVEAHRIAALVEGGMSIDAVIGDYPGLSVAQVEAALAYARMHPKHGRPYPTRTAKSVLRKGGGGGLAAAFAAASDEDDA